MIGLVFYWKDKLQIIGTQSLRNRVYSVGFYDPLTQLANRVLLKERITQALRTKERHPNRDFTVIFIDLNKFKPVNDTYGHLVGDKLLINVSDRLFECVRPHDTVARISGDEFVVVLQDTIQDDIVDTVVTRIKSSIATPFHIDDNWIFITASVGKIIVKNCDLSADEIIDAADKLMYQEKQENNDGR